VKCNARGRGFRFPSLDGALKSKGADTTRLESVRVCA
jgi:hypothetical protein